MDWGWLVLAAISGEDLAQTLPNLLLQSIVGAGLI